MDTFADARDRDILNLAEEMEHDLEADKLCLVEKGNPSVVDVIVVDDRIRCAPLVFCKLSSQTQFLIWMQP